MSSSAQRITHYIPLSTTDLFRYWADDSNPRPWRSPPVLNGGQTVITSLFITTVSGRGYRLDYEDFYRIMAIGSCLKLVHPNNVEEQVLTAHGSYTLPVVTQIDNIIYLPIRAKPGP